ncbi:F-box associated ubiquitination effector family protein, partial [Striga hermonthica]
RRVALVATRFRGRAAVWWVNLSSLRHRQGKQPLSSWIKFCELVEREFVPFNFDSLVYQQLQNLRQGTRSVNEYTTEFHRLLTRVDLHETRNQLVSRYVGGLRTAIRDMLNMFCPESVSDAHQRALLIEVQMAQKPGQLGSSSSRAGAATGVGPQFARPGPATGGGLGSSSAGGRLSASGKNPQRIGGMGGPQQSAVAARTVVGLRCFGCGEMADFSYGGDYEGPPTYDTEAGEVEELVPGDVGTTLVLRRACLAPCSVDSPVERHHLFESTCIVGEKVCRFIIDSGSCENVIAQEAVEKLHLSTIPHLQPYTLAWIQRGNAITVDRRVLVSFSVGPRYRDQIWCDVVSMDACHLLLGRPWQFDRAATHDGRLNTYSFSLEGVRSFCNLLYCALLRRQA